MKKVRLTIKTERTFDFEFNEAILNKDFIDDWDKHITNLKCDPDSIDSYNRKFIDESMFPYINLAENIAYAIHVNDDDHIETLEFQDITGGVFTRLIGTKTFRFIIAGQIIWKQNTNWTNNTLIKNK